MKLLLFRYKKNTVASVWTVSDCQLHFYRPRNMTFGYWPITTGNEKDAKWAWSTQSGCQCKLVSIDTYFFIKLGRLNVNIQTW